jgi:hypothetical protein
MTPFVPKARRQRDHAEQEDDQHRAVGRARHRDPRCDHRLRADDRGGDRVLGPGAAADGRPQAGVHQHLGDHEHDRPPAQPRHARPEPHDEGAEHDEPSRLQAPLHVEHPRSIERRGTQPRVTRCR